MAVPYSELLALAQARSQIMFELRHALHMHPERGNQEHRTAQCIEAALRTLGIAPERMLDTAVSGSLQLGSGGKTAALRADMDALPIDEKTQVPWRSQCGGLMHACGHDFHVAAVLGAAALLTQLRGRVPGTVKLLFQPDEEGSGGAQRMIDCGCLSGVDAIFGAHVDPALPAGCFGFRPGKFYAASNTFRVTVSGVSAHGATPEKGRDALYAAARMVCALRETREALQARHGRVILSVGTLHSGTAGNIIADRAEFSGILRTLGPEARADAAAATRRCIMQTAQACGVEAECTIRGSHPGIVNDAELTLLAKAAVQGLLGKEHTADITEPTMTTEDFGCFLERCPGSFYHIGVGGQFPLHSPYFLPDDHLLPAAAAAHAAVLLAFLEREA